MDPSQPPFNLQAWQLEQFCNLLAKIGMVSLPDTEQHLTYSCIDLGHCMRLDIDAGSKLPLLRSEPEREGIAYTVVFVQLLTLRSAQ